MIFLLQPAADSSVDPEFELRRDDYSRTNISIQDCRSYGCGYSVNEYGPSTSLDPSHPDYKSDEVWVRFVSKHKSIAAAKKAALAYYVVRKS